MKIQSHSPTVLAKLGTIFYSYFNFSLFIFHLREQFRERALLSSEEHRTNQPLPKGIKKTSSPVRVRCINQKMQSCGVIETILKHSSQHEVVRLYYYCRGRGVQIWIFGMTLSFSTLICASILREIGINVKTFIQ